MKLLYFTDSYPYGIGEEWKTNELKVLVKKFKNIHVIPRHYNRNLKPVNPIQGVIYHKPLCPSGINKNALKSIILILLSKHRTYYFREFFSNCFFNLNKIKQWIGSTNFIIEVLKSSLINKLLFTSNEKTVAYFFWGRGTAKIIPLINNTNVSTIIRLHGYDLYLERYKTRYMPYHGSILESCNKVLFISNHGLQYTQRLYPNLKHKFIYSPLGSSSCGNAIMSKDGVLRIVSCSSLIELKRVSLLAETLTKEFHFDIEWIHIGDGPLRNKLLEITESFPENIRFTLTGWIDSNRIQEFYNCKSIDLFINVSNSEGVPVSIMESMSASVPVIATDVGGVSEIVDDSNGILINPNLTPEILKDVICSYYNLDIYKKKSMRDSARKTYEMYFNASINAKKLSEILLTNV